ncbi:winged helix-turn-helix domain-containing protein [Terriglobus albidus]
MTPKQFELLALLLGAKGQTVSNFVLMEQLWSDSKVAKYNLTQAIHRLRLTLGKLPNRGEYIETVRHRGYRISSKALVAPPPRPGQPFERSSWSTNQDAPRSMNAALVRRHREIFVPSSTWSRVVKQIISIVTGFAKGIRRSP